MINISIIILHNVQKHINTLFLHIKNHSYIFYCKTFISVISWFIRNWCKRICVVVVIINLRHLDEYYNNSNSRFRQRREVANFSPNYRYYNGPKPSRDYFSLINTKQRFRYSFALGLGLVCFKTFSISLTNSSPCSFSL